MKQMTREEYLMVEVAILGIAVKQQIYEEKCLNGQLGILDMSEMIILTRKIGEMLKYIEGFKEA